MFKVALIVCLFAIAQAHSVPAPLSATDDFEGIESRIINGNNATNTQFPWFATIVGTLANNQQTLCGGALLSAQWVATAAHCLTGVVTVQVRLGSNNFNTPQISMVSNVRIIHPQYNAQTFANDLALLQLPLNVTTTATIAPIRLPANSQFNTPFTNVTGTVKGFGRTTNNSPVSTVLRFANTRIIPNAECQTWYGTTVVTLNTICTVGLTLSAQGACANDNGGPLSIVEGTIPTLVGIVSFISNSGCEAGHPVGYVRTGRYLTWFNQNTGIPIRA